MQGSGDRRGLIRAMSPSRLSAESPVPFSFASIIEFAGFSFALIAFCVTSKKKKKNKISASPQRYCDTQMGDLHYDSKVMRQAKVYRLTISFFKF